MNQKPTPLAYAIVAALRYDNPDFLPYVNR